MVFLSSLSPFFKVYAKKEAYTNGLVGYKVKRNVKV